MKCAYCGLERIEKGVRYPAYKVYKGNQRKPYIFCSTRCFRSWAVREKAE